MAPDAPTGPAAPGTEPERKSRAGRNLPAAIAVGLGLGGVVLASLYLYRPAFVGVAALAVLIGMWELISAVERLEARPPRIPLLAAGLAIIALAYTTGPDGLVVGLVLAMVTVMMWRLGDGAVGYQRDVGASALVATYVPFLAGFAVLMAVPEDGANRVVAFMATVVCSDIGGYALGVMIGRHPMAPVVSPNKSWEGFVGSLLASAVGGALLLWLLLGAELWEGAVFGVALAVAATLGDLAESMVKRDLGIKDMGRLLPGHGGLMDRLDSLLVAAPVAYLLLEQFVPASV